MYHSTASQVSNVSPISRAEIPAQQSPSIKVDFYHNRILPLSGTFLLYSCVLTHMPYCPSSLFSLSFSCTFAFPAPSSFHTLAVDFARDPTSPYWLPPRVFVHPTSLNCSRRSSFPLIFYNFLSFLFTSCLFSCSP